MDRQIVYIGAIPQDTDLLNTNLDSYIGLAKLSAAVLGTVSLLNNFTCTQTSPASMNVTVSAGEIYALENIDNDTYGSIPPDTTHAIVKQGINLDTTTLTCTAPSTVGNSVNYLVQIGFSETDTGSEVLPYYNSSDPSQAWSGPNNNGTPNYTVRTDSCNVNLKQGVQAPTGTQVTPSPDSGFLGAFVITVAHGATTVINSNISVYNSSNFINETLTQKISQATADTRYAQITSVQNSQYTYGVDSSVSANTVTVTLSPALTSYVAGQSFLIKIANTNTGASTININSLGSKNITYSNGSTLAPSDLVAGGIAILTYDGTAFQVKNPESGNFAPSAVQNNSYIYGNDGGSANAYTLTTTPAVASYTAGLGVIVKIANANTGACTLNVSGLGTKNIKLINGSNPSAGDIVSGMEAWFLYDGTNFQLMNPSYSKTIQNNIYVYGVDGGSANAYTITTTPAVTSYVEGLGVIVKITNANTGASTLNVSSLGTKNIKLTNGNDPDANDLVSGMVARLIYDGTNFQLMNPTLQSKFLGLTSYAASTTSPDTYTASLPIAPSSYVAGLRVLIKFTNANTSTTPTINLNSLGAKTIIRNDGTALLIGDISAGMVAMLSYDGTNFQLMNPSTNIYLDVPNLVIGGEFTVNPWQRGTTFNSTANGAYTGDRFKWIQSGSGVVNITQASDAPTIAQAGIYTSSCLYVDCATADASIAAGDYYGVRHSIEGYNFLPIAQRTFIVSFWVKSTKTGIFCLSLMNSGNDRSYVAEYTINTTNTWEYKTIAVSASPSAGTWTYNNNDAGIILTWTIAAGSTYQTTANAWNTGNFLATSNQVNGMDSNTNDFKLQLIQVEPGTKATPYKALTSKEVWAQCQRYYEKSYNFSDAPGTATQSGALSYQCCQTNTAIFGINGRFAVSKRASPTVTLYSTNSGTAASVYDNGTSTDKTVNSLVGTGANTTGFPILSTTAADTDSIYAQFVADAEI